MVDTVKKAPAKPRKPKSSDTQISKAADKVKVSIVLTSDVDIKLSVHAAYMRVDRSALVNEILANALKRYVVSDRAKPAEDPTQVVSADLTV